MSDDALLARVRKLLAQAEDPSVTEAEAESFNTKAAELIARYGIDQAMLAAEQKTADAIEQLTITIDNPYSHDKARLLGYIAFPLRCRAIQYTSGKSVRKVIVVGYRSDLERVQLLYTSLLLQATSQLTRIRPGDGASRYRESTAAYRRTWFAGFAHAVYARLHTAERQAAHDGAASTSTGQTTALVLRDRARDVADAYERMFPHAKSTRTRRLSGSGYDDGHHAGQRANLNNTGIGGTHTALPSH